MADTSFSLYALPEEHELLRTSVRELCEDKIKPRAAEIDEAAEYPWDVHEALKNADLLAIHIPEQYGGAGADKIAHCIVIEEVARVCASSSLIPMGNKLGTTGLILSGSEELKQQYLPGVAAGESTFSYALSEREAGSDAASMKTRAVRDGDDFVLNGTKAWITGAGVSTHYTLMAVTDPDKGANGISAFVIEATDPGFSVGQKERKMGIKGSPTCEIYFEDCRIPASRLIGAEHTGFKTALKTLDHTRLGIGAQAVGIAQGALGAAVDYVKERRQFGKAIADFPGGQFMLADMAMRIEAARQLPYVAAAKAERGDHDMTFASSAAKCFASDTAMSVTTDAV
ncbi:MAG: acyl-CoA dehydrogenase family protein, partial [Frankiales bacterium]|nr:acyl-CoA dehydrogenase family protein [Frankiales bacterium]